MDEDSTKSFLYIPRYATHAHRLGVYPCPSRLPAQQQQRREHTLQTRSTSTDSKANSYSAKMADERWHEDGMEQMQSK